MIHLRSSDDKGHQKIIFLNIIYILIPGQVKSDPIQIERNLWKVIEQISSLFADLSGNVEKSPGKYLYKVLIFDAVCVKL